MYIVAHYPNNNKIRTVRPIRDGPVKSPRSSSPPPSRLHPARVDQSLPPLPASAEPELLRLPLLPTSPPQPHPRISPAAAGFARSVPKFILGATGSRCCCITRLLYVCNAALIPCVLSLVSYAHGGLSQSMSLWKHSRSHAVSYQTKMGLVSFSPKNRTSSCLQNATCFACFQRRSRGGLSARGHILNAKTNMTSHHKFSSISWKSRTTTSLAQKIGGTGAGLSLSFAVSGIANVVGPVDDGIDTTHTSESSTSYAHGKKVYTEYSVTGIPGDGRCSFRSVAHGECVRSGKPILNENLQRKLADDLRALVAAEFIKRRTD
ncbi:unnamed protein product [Triticum turgidum subsp. durum]|uniref:OTU domain-containing protein n=1 Tax=Triticum turgidum subsp. durum TaxID=4567 RepID=A0A9R0TV12_TRITD|nr:unnamed protein product [Triticum turgidum subsp. durum]